jgi:hypothetical protein
MALNKGFTSPIVQALGGWKSEKMMKRYSAPPARRAGARAAR